MQVKCRHRHLDSDRRCKSCGAKVDLRAPKKNKYGAKKTAVDGIVFDSKREAARFERLKLMLLAGDISDLRADKRDLRFDLVVNGVLICRYEADFTYLRDGCRVAEDTKGFRTAAYRIKKKLMKAVHGIEIVEV